MKEAAALMLKEAERVADSYEKPRSLRVRNVQAIPADASASMSTVRMRALTLKEPSITDTIQHQESALPLTL